MTAADRIDLDQLPAAPQLAQDIHGDEHAVEAEGGLKQDAHTRVHELARPLDALLDRVVREVDEDAAGEARPRLLADQVALAQDDVGAGVVLHLVGVGLVGAPPQELVALRAEQEPRLREGGARPGRGRDGGGSRIHEESMRAVCDESCRTRNEDRPQRADERCGDEATGCVACAHAFRRMDMDSWRSLKVARSMPLQEKFFVVDTPVRVADPPRWVDVLRSAPDAQAGPLATSFWAGGNKFDGEAGLQRALLAPDNAHLLCTLAQSGSNARVPWVMREVGTGGAVDVVALIEEEGREPLLLSVDCKSLAAVAPKDAQNNVRRAKQLDAAMGASMRVPYKRKLVHLCGPSKEELEWAGDDVDVWCMTARCARDGPRRKRTVHLSRWPGVALPPGAKSADVDADLHGASLRLAGRSLKIFLRAGRLAAGLRISPQEHDRIGSDPAWQSMRRDFGAWAFQGVSNEKGFIRLHWERENSDGGLDADSLHAVADPTAARLGFPYTFIASIPTTGRT